MGPPGGDDLPFVFSGTLVTQGQGVAEVLATGMRTDLGRIGKALQHVEPEQTPLQTETGRLVRRLAVVGLSLCALVVVAYGLTRGNTLRRPGRTGFLAGITMAMATLPEEFPVVLTIFLALGAWRISQNHVLTRRVPAIETLGAATVLCVDKTGTLTQNRMYVSQPGGRRRRSSTPSDPADKALPRGVPRARWSSASWPASATRSTRWRRPSRNSASGYLARTEHLHDNWTLVHEYPLSPGLLALSHVWKSPDGRDYVIAAKGAPEAIADLCHLAAGAPGRPRPPGGRDGRARACASWAWPRASSSRGRPARGPARFPLRVPRPGGPGRPGPARPCRPPSRSATRRASASS